MKIKKRDLVFFLLGIITFFIIESIYDWEGTKKALKDGYNDGRNFSVDTKINGE